MLQLQVDSQNLNDAAIKSAALRLYYAGRLPREVAEYLFSIDSTLGAKLIPPLPRLQFEGIFARVLEHFNFELTPKLIRTCSVAKMRRKWDWQDMMENFRGHRYAVNTNKKYAKVARTIIAEGLLDKKCTPLLYDDWITLSDDDLGAAAIAALAKPWRPLINGHEVDHVLAIHKSVLLQNLGVKPSFGAVIDRWLRKAGLEAYNDRQAYAVCGWYEWLRPDGQIQVVKEHKRKNGELYWPICIELWKLPSSSPMKIYMGQGESESSVEVIPCTASNAADYDVARLAQLDHDLRLLESLAVEDVIETIKRTLCLSTPLTPTNLLDITDAGKWPACENSDLERKYI